MDSRCPYCGSSMEVTEMTCAACSVGVIARFPTPRLARLPVEHQRFIELFVLAGGSLKEIAERAGVSYPTVRSRLDKVIEALKQEIERSGEGATDTEQSAANIIKAI